jgi:hypothetical protein
MRFILLIGLCAALTAPGIAAECIWQAEDGGQIEAVHLDDYSYALQAAGEFGTLCAVLRSPEQTTLACDDGSEFELALGQGPDGQTLVVLSDEIYSPICR